MSSHSSFSYRQNKKNRKRAQPHSASPPVHKSRNDKTHPGVPQSIEVMGNVTTPFPVLASTSQSTYAQTTFLVNTHQGTIPEIFQKNQVEKSLIKIK